MISTTHQKRGSRYMPAEWHPHDACLILYPHNPAVFRSEVTKCDRARAEVRNIARSICHFGGEDVFIFCNCKEDAEELKHLLKKESLELATDIEYSNEIIVEICKSDDSWCRDTGPTFILEDDGQELVGIDWEFNAYGGPKEGCYWPCDQDQKIAGNLVTAVSKHYKEGIKLEKIKKFVLEGGSIHSDGNGIIMTTEECLLNKNRNPHLSKEEIETKLLEILGASKVLWLPFGIANDSDTNGHVDNIACFVRPGEVVLSWTDDHNDDNYERFQRAEDILVSNGIRVHKLHIPRVMLYTASQIKSLFFEMSSDSQACERKEGERLAASYVNYYLANDAVILPQFGDRTYDKLAIETMSKIFPELKIVGVDSREILIGGGNIHCITQQVPKKMKRDTTLKI